MKMRQVIVCVDANLLDRLAVVATAARAEHPGAYVSQSALMRSAVHAALHDPGFLRRLGLPPRVIRTLR
jgi:hypothetical protein